MLDNAVAAKRYERLQTSPQMTIGEMITKLETIDPQRKDYKGDTQERHVYLDFCDTRPTGLDSWRGSYREIAIQFDEETSPMSLTEFLALLRGAIGKTYQGYKGGDFVMGKHTPVWVANYGNSGSTGVVGIESDDYVVTVITGKCEY